MIWPKWCWKLIADILSISPLILAIQVHTLISGQNWLKKENQNQIDGWWVVEEVMGNKPWHLNQSFSLYSPIKSKRKQNLIQQNSPNLDFNSFMSCLAWFGFGWPIKRQRDKRLPDWHFSRKVLHVPNPDLPPHKSNLSSEVALRCPPLQRGLTTRARLGEMTSPPHLQLSKFPPQEKSSYTISHVNTSRSFQSEMLGKKRKFSAIGRTLNFSTSSFKMICGTYSNPTSWRICGEGWVVKSLVEGLGWILNKVLFPKSLMKRFWNWGKIKSHAIWENIDPSCEEYGILDIDIL